jgi:AcrR family transcriptional regulator
MARGKNTKEKILQAAIPIFERKGYDGARMQEIADAAGINKALLHYYFDSKEKLFYIIFKKALSLYMPDLKNLLSTEKDLFIIIRKFVSIYLDTLIRYPYIPAFITHELNTKPDRAVEYFKKSGVDFVVVRSVIDKNIGSGKIKNIDAEQLILNVISLCVFPFIGKPVFKGMILDNSEEKFNELMARRKKELAEFIIDAIKK